MLKQNERLEDLEYKGLKIIQSQDGYRFTSDSVLLAGAVLAKPTDKIVDLGTGSGVIATLLSARTGAEAWGIEIQPALAEMAERSVTLNGLTDSVHIVNLDMKSAHKVLGAGKFSIAVCNPPYFTAEQKEVYTEQDICKTEVAITLAEAVRSARRLLTHGGKLYLICKAERLTDLLCAMRAEGVEPKTIRPVCPKQYAPADTVIVQGTKGGKPPLKWLPQLTVYEEDGRVTEETKRIYHQ